MRSPEETAELQRRIDEHPCWWHSLELGGGLHSVGHKSPEVLARELEHLQLPDLRGKSVLDIGAWDGYFSFAAERLGAARVVALDFFSWAADPRALAGHPEQIGDDPVWDEERLPGRGAFDIAHEALGSRVEPVFGDLRHVDPARLGQFDVVLLLGVLYHTRNPAAMLDRVAELTRELLVVETESFTLAGHEHRALGEYFAGAELENDPTNWWSLSETALDGLLRSSQFVDVRFLPPAHPNPDGYGGIPRHRAIAHAYAGKAPAAGVSVPSAARAAAPAARAAVAAPAAAAADTPALHVEQRIRELADAANSAGGCYHAMHPLPGVTIHGIYDMDQVVTSFHLPDDLRGRRVLDVGTASGYFAMACARRGADVTAIDIARRDPYHWAIAELLGWQIDYVELDIYDLDRDFGQFDLVICGSLLLHLPDPLGALRRLRSVCTERAIVSTGAPVHDERAAPLCEFLGEPQDGGAWWAYWNIGAEALRRMLRAADFPEVEHVEHFTLDSPDGVYHVPHVVMHGLVAG